MKLTALILLLACSTLVFADAEADKVAARAQIEIGENEFKAGHFTESLAAFDKAIALVPEFGPHLWQRGITLYYAGKFADARKQFELHKTVNPNDVENAAWHYLCFAAAENAEAAQKALMPIDTAKDTRTGMKEIYAMFAGRGTPQQVLAAVETADGGCVECKFSAYLYVALWYEANRQPSQAKRWMIEAARRADAGGYMGDVAVVHLKRIKETGKKISIPVVDETKLKLEQEKHPEQLTNKDLLHAAQFEFSYGVSGPPWTPSRSIHLYSSGRVVFIYSKEAQDRSLRWTVGQFDVTPEFVADLRQALVDINFLSLAGRYDNQTVTDADAWNMTVKAGGASKTVSAYNYSNQSIEKIMSLVRDSVLDVIESETPIAKDVDQPEASKRISELLREAKELNLNLKLQTGK